MKNRFAYFLPVLLGIFCLVYWFIKERNYGESEQSAFEKNLSSFFHTSKNDSIPSVRSNWKRTSIQWPDDCDFKARSSAENFTHPEDVCAEALDSLRKNLPKDCDYESALSRRDGLIDYQLYAEFLKYSPLRFYYLEDGKFLGELLCVSAPYNRFNIYFIYDEETIPAKTKILSFRKFDFEEGNATLKGSSESETFIRFYKPETKEFVAFIKYRGMGDCGKYFRYRLSPGFDRPILEEMRAKIECDGNDSYSAEEIPINWTRYEIPFDFLHFFKTEIGEKIFGIASDF